MKKFLNYLNSKKVVNWSRAKQLHQSLIINQYLLSLRCLDFIVTARRPMGRMIHNAGTHHIQGNVYEPLVIVMMSISNSI
ncbi:MAG: hypothetical protein ISS66_18530 [Desulfobacteraceae bacterium]|nr:hypothetical protein [Desulfobacteraceae bacterium]